ncbi:hypothetical protein FB451DRAFT_1410362 [Mycena latifolia]|nr:hypothetical protein FB451DRAFT_1410362 [Mycena latifolia]
METCDVQLFQDQGRAARVAKKLLPGKTCRTSSAKVDFKPVGIRKAEEARNQDLRIALDLGELSSTVLVAARNFKDLWLDALGGDLGDGSESWPRHGAPMPRTSSLKVLWAFLALYTAPGATTVGSATAISLLPLPPNVRAAGAVYALVHVPALEADAGLLDARVVHRKREWI